MLTIKHINPGARETIFEADKVERMGGGAICPWLNGETLEAINEGRVYVMNRFGSTVATYDLDVHRGVRGAMNQSTGIAVKDQAIGFAGDYHAAQMAALSASRGQTI